MGIGFVFILMGLEEENLVVLDVGVMQADGLLVFPNGLGLQQLMRQSCGVFLKGSRLLELQAICKWTLELILQLI